MTTEARLPAGARDADLVAKSLAGDRDAFAQIVAQYQSLICSLAYSATGSLSQSEDLAQETFVTAWRQLRNLREPAKLRSWLCSIGRNLVSNSLRQQGREPSYAAQPLDTVQESPALELAPVEVAISKEEETILWRSIERIPELYREPLILFYREHQSVAKVAEALELSEDAVKQRLSRGRKLLHEEVLAFVECALGRTNPGKAFSIGVLAALPAFTISAQAAAVGVTVAKGSGQAAGAAATGFVGALLSPLLAFFGTWIGYRMSLDSAQSIEEQAHIRNFYRKLTGCILGFFVLFGLLMLWARDLVETHRLFLTMLVLCLVLSYTLAFGAVMFWSLRRRRLLVAQLAAQKRSVQGARPAWEFSSRWHPGGWPFIHIRIGGDFITESRPVKAWIAVGDCAIGMLIAFGGIAIAPLSMGGLAIGLLPFGGCALGILALGGTSLGVWSFGGLALGWEAFGGCAIAWSAAAGGVAIAHDFALGAFAHALYANNEEAKVFIRTSWFFSHAQIVLRHLTWLNLIWVLPMLWWWRVALRAKRKETSLR